VVVENSAALRGHGGCGRAVGCTDDGPRMRLFCAPQLRRIFTLDAPHMRSMIRT
jgi:hypothetical protein